MSSRAFLFTLVFVISLGYSVLRAAPTKRQAIVGIAKGITEIDALYKQGKLRDAVSQLKQVQNEILKLADGADDDLRASLKQQCDRLSPTRQLLEFEGYKLPPLKLSASTPKPTPPEPTKPQGVSFTKQIAPLLVSKCGRCHVDKESGKFSMATYAMLMKGPTAGLVVFPTKPDGSRLVEVIEGGEMPPNGRNMSDAELAMLKKWITEGAKFDGDNQQANIADLATTSSTQTAKVEITQPTGKETVSFANDIAPILVESCAGCHVNPPRRASARLNMTTFQQMMRGGDSGPIIVAGNAAQSLLIGKLKGTADGNRMPAGGRPPLSDAMIAKVEKWISEGATFDSKLGPTEAIDKVAALSRAESSSHDQLSADRLAKAGQYWNLVMSNEKKSTVQTENFLVMGNVGENTLKDYADQAEKVVPKIKQMFGASANQPLIKGRFTLFLFQQRYDYSEFGKMVEERSVPGDVRGHWKFSVVDAYGALLPARSDEYSTEVLIAQQIAGAYVASLGNLPPRWFAEGAGRVAASRLGADDKRVVKWNEKLAEITNRMQAPDDFLTGKLAPEDADICSYNYVSGLMKDSKKFQRLLGGLRKGDDFTKAFSNVYGGSPNQLAQYWIRSVKKTRPPRRRTTSSR